MWCALLRAGDSTLTSPVGRGEVGFPKCPDQQDTILRETIESDNEAKWGRASVHSLANPQTPSTPLLLFLE